MNNYYKLEQLMVTQSLNHFCVITIHSKVNALFKTCTKYTHVFVSAELVETGPDDSCSPAYFWTRCI